MFIPIILLILIMMVLFAGNTGSADYNAYKNMYYLIGNITDFSSVEYGFVFFASIGNILGLSYNYFLTFYFIIGLFLILSTIKKYSSNLILPILLYMIYPFLLDIVQIRNFMSMAIIIFGIRYLVEENNFKNNLKYLICVVFASLFHITAYFYLLFFLVRVNNKKKLITFTLLSTLSGLILQGQLPFLFSLFMNSNRYGGYFESNLSFFWVITLVGYFLFNYILMYFIYKKYNINLKKNDLDSISAFQFGEVVIKINIIIIFVLVLATINLNFYRLYRNIIILNHILFIASLNKNLISLRARDIFPSMFMIIFIIISFFGFVLLTNYESVFVPIFSENIFFNVGNLNIY